MTRILFVIALVSTLGCGAATSTLNERKVFDDSRAFAGALNLIRDAAIVAQQQNQITELSARRIITFHKIAFDGLIYAESHKQLLVGWGEKTKIELDRAVAPMNPTEQQILAPYVAMITVLTSSIQ